MTLYGNFFLKGVYIRRRCNGTTVEPFAVACHFPGCKQRVGGPRLPMHSIVPCILPSKGPASGRRSGRRTVQLQLQDGEGRKKTSSSLRVRRSVPVSSELAYACSRNPPHALQSPRCPTTKTRRRRWGSPKYPSSTSIPRKAPNVRPPPIDRTPGTLSHTSHSGRSRPPS